MDQRIIKAVGGGLATTSLVVLGAALVQHFTGFDLFSFSVWLVVPIGAIACGAAAGYGFYWVAHRLHLRPAPWMIPLLLGLGVFAFFATHFLEYQMLTLDDGTRAADIASFGRYLSVKFGSMEIRAGRAMQAGAPLGQAGYWLGVVDFIGFVAGSSWGYFKLKDSLACLRCNQYLRVRGVRPRYFSDDASAADYYDGLFSHPVTDPEFARKASMGLAKGPAVYPAVTITTTLHDCEGCHHQLWTDRVTTFDGKEWRANPTLARSYVFRPEESVVRFVRSTGMRLNLD